MYTVINAYSLSLQSYRLGGGVDDVKAIQNHIFFIGVNWLDVEERKVNCKL